MPLCTFLTSVRIPYLLAIVGIVAGIGGAFESSAQVRRGAKLHLKPRQTFHILTDSNTKAVQAKRPLREPRWVVFSDRQKNAAYTGPGSDVPLKTHGLMDAFYVIGQRGDYLHLMKYNPKVVLRKWRRRVANWKEMQDGGWISRSQLLLSGRAFADPSSQHHTKFVTAISGQYTEVFSQPKRYFEGKDIKVYGAPDFTSSVTGKIPVSSILYAYKASADEKFMLVGKSSQLSPDSAQVEVIGWVPRCLLYRWGERSFWQPLEPPVVPVRSKRPPTTQALVLAAGTDHAETVARLGLPDSLLNGSPHFLQTIFPHFAVVRDTLTAQSALRTGTLTNVFDRRRNKVYNVGGSTISYAQLLQFKNKTRHLNLVFVVDGGEGREATVLQPLLSVVQNIKIKLDSLPYFKQVRYGAVLPGDRQNQCLGESQLPLTADYVTLINFFQDKRQRSLRCPPEPTRDVFSHLKDAADLLRDVKNETNIIIVIGSTSGSSGANVSWNSVVQKLAPVKPRLVVLQARSGESEPYNNFVIDAKTIVLQLANQVSRLKKEILVDPQDVTAENLFTLESHQFQSFSLDYPKNSMWQSTVLFPNKLQKLSPVVMNPYLDTLIAQVHADNTHIITSLETIFNSYVGNVYTHVDQRFKYHFGDYTDALPEGMVRNLYADLDFFALPARLPYTSADGSLLGSSGVFLGADELQSMSLNFGRLGAPWQQQTLLSRRQAYVQLRKSIKAYRKQKVLPTDRKAKHLTLSEVTGLFTDYAPEMSQWSQYTLRHLKQKKKMPEADYRLITKMWSDYHTKLKSYYNDADIVKYRSLNKDYYWIPYRF